MLLHSPDREEPSRETEMATCPFRPGFFRVPRPRNREREEEADDERGGQWLTVEAGP